MLQPDDEDTMKNEQIIEEIPLISDVYSYRFYPLSYRFLKNAEGKLILIPVRNVASEISMLFISIVVYIFFLIVGKSFIIFTSSIFLFLLLMYLYVGTVIPFSVEVEGDCLRLNLNRMYGGKRLVTFSSHEIHSITMKVRNSSRLLFPVYWGEVGIESQTGRKIIFFRLACSGEEKAKYYSNIVAERLADELSVPVRSNLIKS